MPTRRHVLALLAASAIPGCSGAPLPDPIAAWRDPGAGEADPRRFALAHAILAPNPHNRQPWLVELAGENELWLFPDLDRLLPATDPFDRQITIGCGAFVELLTLAAAARGLAAEVSVFPEGAGARRLDARPFAHVRLVEGGAPDALFAQISVRRTNRQPFETRDVRAEALAALGQTIAEPGLRFSWANDGVTRGGLRALAWAAFDREAHTPAAHQETAHLLRVGRHEIARHRDGISVEGPAIEVAQRLGLVNLSVLSNPDHWMTKPSIEAWRPLAEDAPAFAWIIRNTRATQIAAGRAYARLNLAATAQGLAVHPWSQALQEYPEMAQHYAEAKRLTGAGEGETLQMLVRVGYGPAIAPSPRRGLAEHLRA